MKIMMMAAVAGVLFAPACMAANVNNPYGNIDHRNDAGNDTGDSQVDRLNQAQLGGAYGYGRRYAPPGAYPQARPYAGAIYAPAPRAYYPPPPPPYAAPPGYYPPPY